MSLGNKAWAWLNTLPMSVPSRLALWLGLGAMMTGYWYNQPPFTVVGGLLILTGAGMWLVFRPKGGGLRGLVGLKPRDPNLPPSKLERVLSKLVPKTGEKKRQIQEAIAKAQIDPKLQAKRKNLD